MKNNTKKLCLYNDLDQILSNNIKYPFEEIKYIPIILELIIDKYIN